MKLIKIVKNIYRNLFFTLSNVTKPAVTIKYPEERRVFPDKLRIGTFGLTSNEETGEENCIACKLCEKICPSEIIEIDIEIEPFNIAIIIALHDPCIGKPLF